MNVALAAAIVISVSLHAQKLAIAENIAMSDSERIVAMQQELEELKSRLDKLSKAKNAEESVFAPTAGAENVPYWGGAKFCPDGQYAVGIRAWGSPDSTRYCIGCLTGVAIVCKQFPQ